MTRDQFTAFLRNPETIASYATDELQQLVNDFPYCQPLRTLQLKQLKVNDSIQYSQRLKETAAYSPDRVKLYQLMNRSSKNITPVGISAFPDLVENTIDQNPSSEEIKDDLPIITEEPIIEIAEEKHEIIENASDAIEIEEIESTTEEPDEISPHDIIVNRLKELNLWEEKEEDQKEEQTTSEHTQPIEVPVEAIEHIDEPTNEEQHTAIESKESTIIDEPTEINSISGNDEQDDHDTLISGYLESITQSNEVISPLVNESPKTSAREKETPVLSFTEWLKRKDFPQEENQVIQKATESSHEEPKENATPVVAKVLYIKEDLAHQSSLPAELPASDIQEIQKEDVQNSSSISDTPPPVRTLRTNEELGLKDVIRPIKKGRAAERKNKNKSEEKTQDTKPTKAPEYQNKIIDRFIEEEPRITPIKATIYNPVNMARKSTIQPDDVVTETLAMIYAQQGNYEKAISFYEKLSLKFPEKSVYFASLIQELKNKQNQ